MPQAALAVAAWVGSVAFSAASAVGLGVAAAATVANVAVIAAAGSAVYGVVKAAEALTPKIKSAAGGSSSWQADPRAGIPYGIGRCAIGGNIVFNQSAGSSNKYLNFVTVYSGAGPIDSFEAFQCNGSTVHFLADGGEGASGYYLNRMWLRSQVGQQSEGWLRWTAVGSKDTPSNHGGMPTEWTASHKLSGYAATLWGLEYDPERYAGGVPTPRMIGKWVKVYDPRKDSTYPGGAGPHRIDDEATWEWSKNGGLHALTWNIGRRAGAVVTHGLGAEPDEIDIPAYVYAANVADANNWTANGVVTSTDDKWEVLKALLQTCAALPILGGSMISCMVNAPAVSLATITADDIVGAATVPAQVASTDRINTVWPSYMEEALDWQVVTPDAPVQVAQYVALDREERSIELGMPLVGQATQAGQLSRYAIEDARELNGIILQVLPKWMWIPPGVCVTVSAPETGLNGQKVRILKRTRDPATKTVTWTVRTETDGKHPFALGQTNLPPATPALTAYDASIVPLPGAAAFTVTGGVIVGDAGRKPAIIVKGEADLYEAASIVVGYRKVNADGSLGDWMSQSFSAKETTLVVDQGVEALATYEVRIRYATASGVENSNTGRALGTVTTGALVATDVVQIGGRPTNAVLSDLQAAVDISAFEHLTGQAFRTQTNATVGAQRTDLDQLVAKTEDHAVVIAQLLYVNAETGEARAVFAIDVNGHVIGQVNTNDGTIGATYFSADIFGIVGTDPLNPKKPFEINTITGKLAITADVEINGNLVVTGSITTPAMADRSINDGLFLTRSATTYGTGSEVAIFPTQTFTLPYAATVIVEGDLAFKDGGGNGPGYHQSKLRILINGVQANLNEAGDVVACSTLAITGIAEAAAGTVTVSLMGSTKPADYYTIGNLRIRWSYK